MACLILLRTASLVTWSLYDTSNIFRKHLISMACMTREHISLNFKLTVMFLSFHKGFNFVSAAVVCAILASISGLEPSTVIIDTKYLKLVTVSSLCPLTLTSVLMLCVLFVISVVFSAV